jgi:hypothetical protein
MYVNASSNAGRSRLLCEVLLACRRIARVFELSEWGDGKGFLVYKMLPAWALFGVVTLHSLNW